jgi:hypothetical protein
MDKIAEFVKAEADYEPCNGNAVPQVAPSPAVGLSPSHISRIFMSHFGFMGIF